MPASTSSIVGCILGTAVGDAFGLLYEGLSSRRGVRLVEFGRQLARRLRWWLLGLPAGIGFATLRALLKLWMNVPPSRSGVFRRATAPSCGARS